MAGIKGKSGPPGNQNAFQHGLSAVDQRRTNGALTPDEQSIREEILAGLIQDKGGDAQIGTATRILAEVISSDAAWLIAFNKATDAVMEKNEKARANPAALAKLDGYKRGLVNSLTSNLQRFGFDKVAKVETLREIIEEMADQDETSGETNTTSPGATDPEKTQGLSRKSQGTPSKIEIRENQE
ncbi:MAG TPA: hypothetical protein VGK77_23920 [Candidatus Binatia bacterium]